MKNILSIFLVIVCSNCNFFAQTFVFGGAVRGTWTKVNSPYLVQGAIMIANDSTLTIEPGVKVEFQGHYKLLVMGKLIAVGTAIDTIQFTTNNVSLGWFGIRFENTASTNDTSRISFCKIQRAKANGGSYNDYGGALYLNNFSKLKVSNSLISNCTADLNGGAISCSYSNPVIINSKIINNTAINGNGGGIYCENNSSATIFGNIISSNSASGNGGGIFNHMDCNSLIANNTISYNSISSAMGNGGGGIINVANSATITNNVISYNSVPNSTGGGITDISTGGVYFSLISSNYISNNTALHGAGLYCNGDNLPVINNVISNNTASNSGGGIRCENSCAAVITNNTITNNSSPLGGGIFFTVNSSPTIKNCIIWGNIESTSGKQVFMDDETSDPNFYYCDIMAGQSAIGLNNNVFYLGNYSNNINASPLFVSPSLGVGNGFSSMLNGWNIQNGSPCINLGDPSGTYSSTDITGNNRISGTRIDIGAFESLSSVGLNNESNQELIFIYPNPISSSANIVFEEFHINSVLIITDILGNDVEKVNFSGRRIMIEKGLKHSGIYFITIADSQSKLIFKQKIIIL